MAQADELSFEVANQLRRCIRTARPIDAAQVKVIGLDAVREAAGERWSAMADRVRQNALNFIRGCVDADDVVIPAGDGFLVIYSVSEGRDYEREAAALHDALNAFYLGEESTRNVRVSVERRTMEPDALDGLIWARDEPPAKPADSVSFVPLWSAKLEVIGAYYATPMYSEVDETRMGYDTHFSVTGRHGDCDFLDIDLAVFEHALHGAEEVDKQNLRCLVGFTIHATTLQRRSHWAAYHARLARVPPGLRTWLSAKIAEIEPGTPGVTLADWVSRLNNAASTVALGLHHTDQGIGYLQSTRANAVAVTLSERSMGVRGYAEQSRRLIDRWTPILHRQRIGLCLDGVEQQDLLAYACEARVDSMTGIKFWPAVSAPSGVWAIPRAEVVGKPAATAAMR